MTSLDAEQMREKSWRPPGPSAHRQILMAAHAWLRSALDCKDWVWDVDQWNAANDTANALLALALAKATDRYRCKKCGTLWRLNPPDQVQPEGSWSLYDGDQKPSKCCDNNPSFLSVIEPMLDAEGTHSK